MTSNPEDKDSSQSPEDWLLAFVDTVSKTDMSHRKKRKRIEVECEHADTISSHHNWNSRSLGHHALGEMLGLEQDRVLVPLN